jgi:hypothetical protein
VKFGRMLARAGHPVIASNEIEFGECRLRQVVCPHCAEPVFKVQGRVREYLSHYEWKGERDCEWRVHALGLARYPLIQIRYPNDADLARHLAHFETIVLEGRSPEARKEVLHWINKMRSRKFLCGLLTGLRGIHRRHLLLRGGDPVLLGGEETPLKLTGRRAAGLTLRLHHGMSSCEVYTTLRH